jgi:hypothetical protein
MPPARRRPASERVPQDPRRRRVHRRHRPRRAGPRAAILLARLGACDDLLPGGEGDVPAALHGLLRDLVPAVRDLAGPAWLDASGDDPDAAAFTVPEAAASPPDRARIDEICSRVLWARFAPGTGRDDPGHGGADPASQPPPRPPAAALRLKAASARTRPDSSKDIRPFIAKITLRPDGRSAAPRCATV